MSFDSQFLVDEIVEVTGDKKSLKYWRYAVNLLGETAEIDLGEVKHMIRVGEIKGTPAKCLTFLFEQRIAQLKETRKPAAPANKPLEKSYLSPTQLTLFSELQPRSIVEGEQREEKKMAVPYSTKHIPWATFVGPDFFTLSTNTSKSDKVTAKFRTMEGQLIEVSLLRGRSFPGDSARGILTAEHGRVLGALENIWASQGCHFVQTKSGAVNCFCVVKMRDLAKLIGWRNFGGQGLNYLKKLVFDLKAMPYYLEIGDLPEFKTAGLKGYGFTLVGDVTVLDVSNNRFKGTVIRVGFSDTYSRQLLARRVVTRSLELITSRSELAFLLNLYIEPFLIKNGHFSKGLKLIIEDLNLPAAGWHKQKGLRKQQFTKAIRELSNKKTGTGQTITIGIVKGLYDYLLEARLSGEPMLNTMNASNEQS